MNAALFPRVFSLHVARLTLRYSGVLWRNLLPDRTNLQRRTFISPRKIPVIEMTAVSKEENIWSKIQNSAYSLDELPQNDPGTFARISLLRSNFDKVSFEHTDDEMPEGRKKLLHAHGSVAKVEFQVKENSVFTGIFKSGGMGLARLSLALWEHDHFIPGMAVKIFVDGGPSQNLHLMNGLDGQGKNRNFFEHKFWNVLAHPTEMAGKLLASPFGKAVRRLPGDALDKPENEVTLGLMEQAMVNCRGEATVGKPSVPYQLIFTPNPANAWSPDSKEDLRVHLHRIPPGTLLYNVSARRIPNGPVDHLGELITRSGFVASQYGDEMLFFQHARKRWQP